MEYALEREWVPHFFVLTETKMFYAEIQPEVMEPEEAEEEEAEFGRQTSKEREVINLHLIDDSKFQNC